MQGTIRKATSGWVVDYIVESENPNAIYTLITLPLYPDDVKQIDEWSKIFDNIEARIASSPEVEFEIIPCIPKDLEPTRGETLSFESIKYAKLFHSVFKPGLSKETLDELFEAHDPEDFTDEDTKDWERASLEDFIDEGNDNGWIKDYIEIGLEDEVLIELEDWNHTCGDGCCYTYGTNIYINGEQIEDEDGINPHQLLKAVLTKLGYTNVRVEYK